MTNLIQQTGIDLVVALVVNANAHGDATKKSARASEILAISTALTQVNGGDTVAGLAALEAALNSKALDPGEALALQHFTQFVAVQASAAAQLGGGTLLGQLDSAVLANVLSEVEVACKAYVTDPAAPKPLA